jgi:ABC-2 type transport system ATP-binding protein
VNIIEVKNLTHRYKNASYNSVDTISFGIEKNNFFTFLGPNGAGKSTVIQILTTALIPTSGTVIIDGCDVVKNPREIQKKIGVITQQHSLDNGLTGEENIRVHVANYGLYPFVFNYKKMPNSYKKKLLELSDILELDFDALFRTTARLSGGMARKVEIIKSLIHEPAILFLDEPTQGLDPLSRQEVWAYLNKLRLEKNITMFLTTHYLDEAEQTDRIMIINNGTIVKDTTPKEWKNSLPNKILEITPKYTPLEIQYELMAYNFANHVADARKVYVTISGVEEAQCILSKLTLPIIDFRIVNPTLEELYIDLIKS